MLKKREVGMASKGNSDKLKKKMPLAARTRFQRLNWYHFCGHKRLKTRFLTVRLGQLTAYPNYLLEIGFKDL